MKRKILIPAMDIDPAPSGRNAGGAHAGAVTTARIGHVPLRHVSTLSATSAATTIAVEPPTVMCRCVAGVPRRTALFRPVIFERVARRCFGCSVLRHVPRMFTRGKGRYEANRRPYQIPSVGGLESEVQGAGDWQHDESPHGIHDQLSGRLWSRRPGRHRLCERPRRGSGTRSLEQHLRIVIVRRLKLDYKRAK